MNRSQTACIAIFLALSFFAGSLSAQSDFNWNRIIQRLPQYKNLFQNPDSCRLRMIYSSVEHTDFSTVVQTTSWDKNSKLLFYSASAVKMITAIFALEKLNRNDRMDLNCTIVYDSVPVCDGAIYYQYNRLSFREIITKMLVLSDNIAFNYMYDFVGPEYFHNRFHEMGYDSCVMVNRFLNCDSIQHMKTMGFTVFDSTGKDVYRQGRIYFEKEIVNPHQDAVVGSRHFTYKGTRPGGKSFRHRNNIELNDLHTMLIALVYPENAEQKKRYHLTDQDRYFLIRLLGSVPREYGYRSEEDTSQMMHDGRTKYLYVGASKDPIPDHIRIINIIGQSFGFMTDVMYFVDFEKGIDFFLSMTSYQNKNGIIGDGIYGMEEVSFPFFEQIGKEVYQDEILQKRTAKELPDFLIKIFEP